MKKIFFLAAAVMAALSMNAASFTGFSAETTALGEQIAAGLATNLVNIEFAETSAGKYSANLVAGGQEGSFSFGGVVFAYTNSNAGTTAYKTYGTYIQPNGKDREIRIPAKKGEKVRIVLTEACAGVLVNETSTDLVSGENILTADQDGIVLKTVSTKPKLQAIQPAAAQGVEDVNASVKAVKRIVNGQVVIEREGRLFNALGAEL